MINQITKDAEYCECPNCKTVGKTRNIETKENVPLSLPIYVIGAALGIIFSMLGSTCAGSNDTPALGVVISGLWFIYFLFLKKDAAHYKVCPRCGYEHIIPLSREEYEQKVNS